jgi:hypothetical protein
VKRLAALDMWGTAGTKRRRRLIRLEFFLGAIGCIGLGAFILATGNGWMILAGLWLIGAGINYIALARHAQSLSRPGALEAELERVNLGPELHRAGLQQLWIAVPLAIAVFDVFGADPSRDRAPSRQGEVAPRSHDPAKRGDSRQSPRAQNPHR